MKQQIMKLIIFYCVLLCSITFIQSVPAETSKTEQAIKVLVKAYETYQELEEGKDEGEKNLVVVMNGIPIEQMIDPNSINVGKQEEDDQSSKTLRRIAWKIAKLIIKKVISMLS